MKTTNKLFVLVQTFFQIVFEQYDTLFPCYIKDKKSHAVDHSYNRAFHFKSKKR